MQIGIFGTGRMGMSLAKQWASKGHQIYLGSRDPHKAKALAAEMGADVRGGSVAEASDFGQVLLLAVVWAGVADTIEAAGNMDGKVLIDCTLPLVNRQLAVDSNSSGAEEIAKLAPGAQVVKAFNTIYYEHFKNPKIGSERISMFYCGDSKNAKAIVAQLGSEIGLDVVDSGPLFNSQRLEAMGLLWIYMTMGVGYGNDIAFKLLR